MFLAEIDEIIFLNILEVENIYVQIWSGFADVGMVSDHADDVTRLGILGHQGVHLGFGDVGTFILLSQTRPDLRSTPFSSKSAIGCF